MLTGFSFEPDPEEDDDGPPGFDLSPPEEDAGPDDSCLNTFALDDATVSATGDSGPAWNKAAAPCGTPCVSSPPPYPFPWMNESTSRTSGEYSSSNAPMESRRWWPPTPDPRSDPDPDPDPDPALLLPSGVEWRDSSAALARAASASASTLIASTESTDAATLPPAPADCPTPPCVAPCVAPAPSGPPLGTSARYRSSSCEGAHRAGKSRRDSRAAGPSADINAAMARRWSSMSRSRVSSAAASRSAATARDARA